MSTSMVTLKRACSLTRPASRLDDAVESVNGDYAFRGHWTGICNYQYQNILDRFKIKTLIVQTNQLELKLINGLVK